MKDAQAAFQVTFAYDRALWRRGMTGWWQSVVPPAPFVQRAIFWAIIWAVIGALAIALSAVGMSVVFVGAGLVGAGFMIAAFGYLQRTRMSRFWDEIGRHWDRAGQTRIIFDHVGLSIADDVSERRLSWPAIDAVRAVRGGTVIRSGISMLVVPDTALPDGMDARAFRARLGAWRRP